jgi:hypothetical protein
MTSFEFSLYCPAKRVFMKKVAGLFILFCCLVTAKSQAQHVTFSELVQLKESTFQNFEDVMHVKGYHFLHVTKGDNQCATFKKDDNIISYCTGRRREDDDTKDNANKDVTVLCEFLRRADYIAMNGQIVETEARKSKTHTLDNGTEITHLYIDNDMSVHLRTVMFRKSKEHAYQVLIFSNTENESIPDRNIRSNESYYDYDPK